MIDDKDSGGDDDDNDNNVAYWVAGFSIRSPRPGQFEHRIFDADEGYFSARLKPAGLVR